MKTITVNKINEQIKILEDLKNKKITQKEAAQRFNCTARNMRTKFKKYVIKGQESLIHGNKSRASLRKVSLKYKNIILDLCKPSLADAGPKYISDKILELHSYKISAKTIRKIMINHDCSGQVKVDRLFKRN